MDTAKMATTITGRAMIEVNMMIYPLCIILLGVILYTVQ